MSEGFQFSGRTVMTMTRENDARWHRDIENTLAFLILSERGFGVGKMDFFDGASPGYASVVESIVDESGVGSDGRCNQVADDARAIKGSVILAGDQPGIQFMPCGASELGMVAKCKLAERWPGKMIFSGDTQPARGFSPFRMEANQLIYEKIDPTDRIVEVRTVAIAESGEATRVMKNYMIRNKKGGWFAMKPPRRLGDNRFGLQHDHEQLAFSLGVGITKVSEFWWRVVIRFDGRKPGVMLFTDATGVKDFFRFRDVPEGKKRRDALLHWVTDHWRQNRRDPEIENYVREFLRGSREFSWHGLSGTIELPKTDLDRQEAAIVGRKRLKREELDRRIRATRSRQERR